MKGSKADTIHKSRHFPALRFEDPQLTSFSGLILFQQLFVLISLREKLRLCFRHLNVQSIFGHGRIVLLLIIHFLLGYRQLGELRFYGDDPVVQRVIGPKRLPDVATINRVLAHADDKSVTNLQHLLRQMVLQRLMALDLRTITLDFDGSVIGIGRFAEGAAIGFNRKKKGQRSYYQLFCTIAQTGQVFDVLHRSGNAHDANGAKAFIRQCIEQVQRALPGVRIETRMDGAFFSQTIVQMLEVLGAEYTLSVPFERLMTLKQKVEQRKRWPSITPLTAMLSRCAENPNPGPDATASSSSASRSGSSARNLSSSIFFSRSNTVKVILTNKSLTPARVLAFHNGRGSQESLFAELKSVAALAYVPTRTWIGKQIYLVAALMAHNLSRELQMRARKPERDTKENRPALWSLASIATIRHRIIQRADRLIYPKGKLTLSMSANEVVRNELLQSLAALGVAD